MVAKRKAETRCDEAVEPDVNREAPRNEPDVKREAPRALPTQGDPWAHRSVYMKCITCMHFVRKASINPNAIIGRCRRHAPTMSGYPVVLTTDWCGDHKLTENI